VEAAGVEPGASQPAAFVTCFFSYTYRAAFAVCATRVPFEDLGSKLRPHHPWERRPAHTCEPPASPGRFRGWALPPSLNFTETLDAILRPEQYWRVSSIDEEREGVPILPPCPIPVVGE